VTPNCTATKNIEVIFANGNVRGGIESFSHFGKIKLDDLMAGDFQGFYL